MRVRPFLVAALLVTFALVPRSSSARSSNPSPKPSASRSPAVFDQDDRMDVNNLDMVVTNYGSFAYDLIIGNAGLVYPKGSDHTAIFAAGLWIGGRVNGEVRATVAEYAMEFVPGPMIGGTFSPDDISYRNYEIVRGNTTSEDYLNWPVSQGAPVDANGAPQLLGDAMIWSVYNDANPAQHVDNAGMTAPLGLEIQQSTFAFNRSGPLGDMIFFRWKLLNKGDNPIDQAYVSIWSDPDLGGPVDDLVGCDTTLALGYCYNATNADAVYASRPPAVGFQLLRGPIETGASGVADTLGMTSFNRYINGTDPTSAVETYFYMLGLDAGGQDVHVFGDPAQPVTRYLYSGLDPSAPSSPSNWLDSNPSDRRMMVSSGPFTMAPGSTQEIRAVLIVGQGTDRLSSITDLRSKAALAKAVFDPPPLPPPVAATVDISPVVIALAGHAPWVTAFVESEAFAPEDVLLASVRLAGVPADPKWAIVGDHDGNGAPELGLKFSRASLAPFLTPGMNHLTLTGALSTGARFEGAGDVRVIPAPPTGPRASVAPNPLNPTGTLRFETTIPGPARIRIIDVTGRLVRTVEAGTLGAGQHALPIAGFGDLSSGVYLFRLETAEGRSEGRFVVLK